MKMQMIKYLFPIILALTVPAAAAPEKCTTPDMVKNIMHETEPLAVVWHELKQVDVGDEDLEDVIIFRKDHDYFATFFAKGCFVSAEPVDEDQAVIFYQKNTKRAD